MNMNKVVKLSLNGIELIGGLINQGGDNKTGIWYGIYNERYNHI